MQGAPAVSRLQFNIGINSPAIARQRLVLHAAPPGGCACLQVCGQAIKAHKLILMTQCDYFKKMLAPDQFEEGTTNTVKVRTRLFVW
jgi:hypothetical protein